MSDRSAAERLSPENRALIERVVGPLPVGAYGDTVLAGDERLNQLLDAARVEGSAPLSGEGWKFWRYVDGQRMAEGATITKATSLEEACRRAAALFSDRPGSVFVLDPALSPHPPVIGGEWRLVPVEPTAWMCRAGAREHFGSLGDNRSTRQSASEIWTAMLAAAPSPSNPPTSGESA